MTKQDFYYLVDEFKFRLTASHGKWHIDGCTEPFVSYGYVINQYKENTLFRFKRNYSSSCIDYIVYVDEVKPYLRPLETITIKEQYSLETTLLDQTIFYIIRSSLTKTFLMDHYYIMDNDLREWYCNHWFDDNNLIEKGYALEAPKGMYK